MSENLVWIDLEMTGLDPDKHVIIEIATIITDSNLEIVKEGPNIIINYDDHILESMEEWSRIHHKASGLLDKVKASSYTCKQAEKETLEFISEYCKDQESPLCGNSVYNDRKFLTKYMQDLESFLHYRLIDVSTVKELFKRWYPDQSEYEKKTEHLALSDIKESIKELKYYRERIFK